MKENLSAKMIYEDFIDQLTQLRLDAGLTQADVSKGTKLTQAQISNMENGSVNPRLDTLIRIAEFYGKTITFK